MNGIAAHYIFREVRDESELHALLALRFRVYRETEGMRNMRSLDESAGLDVDVFDLYAWHFGLFTPSEEGEALVGGMRIVGTEPAKSASLVWALCRSSCSLRSRLEGSRPTLLPSASFLEDGAAVQHFVAKALSRGERIAEPGRLVLDPTHRAHAGSSGRHVARHMLDSAVGFWLCEGIRLAMLTCVPLHVGFYRPYGFAEMPGTTTRFQPYLGKEMACLVLNADDVSSRARIRCSAVADRLERYGESCTCVGEPSCRSRDMHETRESASTLRSTHVHSCAA